MTIQPLHRMVLTSGPQPCSR
ncbi:MAG: hypothetical protein RIS85_601, partial [Pseudomonadota bacterium]